jgi:hypothetical protein
MAIADQQKAILELGKLGRDIPGLNADSVIENLIKKDENLGKYFEMMDAAKEEKIYRGMSEEEAEAAVAADKEKMVEDLKKSIKPSVEEDIIKMKQEYKIAKEALDSIPDEVKSVMAGTIIPPAISAPPSAANPLYTLNVALQAKKNMLKTLNIVLSSLTAVMLLANKLKFELPKAVTALVATLATVTGVLSKIPG